VFKHILIPTDGSPVSTKAIQAGIALAKQSGAQVTGFMALDAVPAHLYKEGFAAEEQLMAEFEKRSRTAARKHVAVMARAAHKAGVRFDSVVVAARTPYEGIVEAAQKHNCDLILMASNGRRGLARLAVGSVTDKVIQLSKVPVLVYR
jgi:nucleotide-binding universal stress UspA family protein